MSLVVLTVVAIKIPVHIMTLEAADNSEKSVNVYQSTPRHILLKKFQKICVIRSTKCVAFFCGVLKEIRN